MSYSLPNNWNDIRGANTMFRQLAFFCVEWGQYTGPAKRQTTPDCY